MSFSTLALIGAPFAIGGASKVMGGVDPKYNGPQLQQSDVYIPPPGTKQTTKPAKVKSATTTTPSVVNQQVVLMGVCLFLSCCIGISSVLMLVLMHN